MTKASKMHKKHQMEFRVAGLTAWTALPLVAGNASILTLTDPAAGGTQRFYRVRQW
jgi:hypothetical protein